jgi:hypothetical protein
MVNINKKHSDVNGKKCKKMRPFTYTIGKHVVKCFNRKIEQL